MQDEILYRRSAIQDSSVPDALFVPENKKRGRTLWDRLNSILDIAEPMLGVDRSKGERAYIRRQGDGWLFITKNPEDTIYHPLQTPLQRRPRYVWTDGLDGIRRGYFQATIDR